MATMTQSRLGQTITRGGHSYALEAVSGGAHRWVRTDQQQQPSSPQTPQQSVQPDHAARHAFTRSQLANVQGPARGIMAALHAHPEAQAGGRVVSQDFAAEPLNHLHQWLRQNVGKQAGGGHVVDMGKGRIGFATPAGSIMVGPGPKGLEVKYTNQTGLVAQAMGGGIQPSAGAATPPTPQAPRSQPIAPMATSAGPPPVISKPPPAPGFETSRASHEQMASASALMENPAPTPEPQETRNPRQIADETKQHLQQATAQWQKELAGGLSPKGNARWRSYLAALNSIHGHQEKAARSFEKQGTAAGGKAAAPAASSADPELSKMEQQIHAYDPHALKQIREMTQRPEGYRDLVKQYHEALYPKQQEPPQRLFEQLEEKPKEKSAQSDPRLQQPSSEQVEQPKPKPQVPAAALPPGSERAAMERLGIKPQTAGGEPTASSPPAFLSSWPSSPESQSPTIPSLKPQYSSIAGQNKWGKPKWVNARQIFEHSKAKKEREAQMRAEARRGFASPSVEQPPKKIPRVERLKQMAGELGGTRGPEAQKLLASAIEAGHIQKPSQLRSVLRTAAKLHQRGNVAESDLPAHKEAIRRLRNRQGKEAWQSIAKREAEQWGMSPEQYNTIAKDIHGEFVEHHKAREAAKEHAREATKMTAADINRLENKGFDSATAKHFDEVGRDLASQHPGVFGGTGYGDEANMDYGSELWDLIREGKKPLPTRTSPEFLEHLDAFLSSQRRGADQAQESPADEGEQTPFSMRWPAGATLEKYREFLADRVKAAAAETEKPSEAQASAGNYRKGKVRMHGLTVTIENPAGSKRREEWPPLSCHYGYVNRVRGKDGDQLDVFIGPDPESQIVFVIDQVTAGGHFDEHKCMLGFSNERAAKEAYLANYPKGWRVGKITPITMDQFRDWIGEGDKNKRIAEQV